MMYALVAAFASPAADCIQPASTPPRSVPFVLVGRYFGLTHYERDGESIETSPGAAVVPAGGVADLVRPMLRADQLATVDPSLVGPPDARYLVVWWPEPVLRFPVIETVWLRHSETLVSLISRSRELPWSHTVETTTTTAVQIFVLPPGDYPPAGIVFTEVQWPGDEDQDGPEDGIE
jgi:hypothetical protein